MGELLKSATEFLAAILSALGFVGHTRRRSNIHLDLKLLDELRGTPEFGSDSVAAMLMMQHVTNEVAKLTGAEVARRKKIAWSTVISAVVMGGTAFYFARWGSLSTVLSTILYVFAGLMAVSILGSLLPDSQVEPDAAEADEDLPADP